jgi:alanine racemase
MISSVFEDADIVLRPTVVEVHLNALRFNFAGIRKAVGKTRIMAVVKANAYGHGLVRTSRELVAAGADSLGVAFLEEGIALRKAGLKCPILVLGGIIGNQVHHFLDYDLDLTASSVYKLQQIDEIAREMNRRACVHLKIDTGMGRIGINHLNAESLFRAAAEASHCETAGVFTHFASAQSPDTSFTKLQIERFNKALEFYPRNGLTMPTRHAANSAAVLQHPDAYFDMVRPGIMLFGVYPSDDVAHTIPLKPVMSFKSRVVFFKVVQPGTPLGYDGTWIAPRQTRIVTLPVGYGDGYFRALSGCGDVLMHGRRYPIAGTISMDQCMIDIGGDSAYNGDEAVMIGPQGTECITCEEIASKVGTIPYEVLTSINTRVPRKYIEEIM